MKRDKLNRKLAEFDRLFKNYYEKSFELQKTEVMRIEQEVRKIVGNDPDFLDSEILRDRREDLLLLLESRRTLMNWMYKETDEEVARMEIVNSRLFELTKRLRVKMAEVCESVASRARDDFDDDFNVEGTLRFCYNGEESLLSYPGADAYGSDYRLMIVTNNWLTGDDPLHYLEMSCRINASRESILQTDDLDDDLSWEHDVPGCYEFYICHTTAIFCRDFGYPIQDVLQLNDFWNEVKITYQQFATQDPNYKYPRE